MSEKTLKMTMLLDFYGELLTERQRTCLGMYYNEDMSLAEIAEILGISRQGVHDIILRGSAALSETEEKTGLVGRFAEQRGIMRSMDAQLRELLLKTDGEAREIALSLIGELERIKDG